MLSEQFNEKLMNEYEALNIEFMTAKKENEMFVSENLKMD